ncbi:MAG TPA: PGPGW domain-containing protein [Gammaproteobacteria bacterium]|jgi:tellurite resistance protein TerC
MVYEALNVAYKTARKIVIGTIGFTVVLVGIVLLVLPGPAFLVIPAGLAILALEFAWARHWLKVVRTRAGNALNGAKHRNKQKEFTDSAGHRPGGNTERKE